MKNLIPIILIAISLNAHGDEALTPAEKSKAADERIEAADKNIEAAQKEAEAIELEKQNRITQSDLDNFGFGLGFGAMLLNEPDIQNAVIENGIIRVTEEEKQKMGFWLTASWIHDSWPTRQIGFGPFFGIQLGDNNEIVNSIAMGIDFSFKRLSSKLPLDFQIGYGITRIEKLANGYSEDSNAPTGATQVLKKKTTGKGFVLIFSYKI